MAFNLGNVLKSFGNLFNFTKPMSERLIVSSNPEKDTFAKTVGQELSNAWGDYTGITANEENIEYQNDYNEEVWKRADTQYQRTVADLRAAGLSSQLAAGSPSTVAGNTQAPERTVGNESAAIEKLVGMVNAIKQTNASVNLTNAQADKAKAETDLVNKESGSYSERLSVDLAMKRQETALNAAYTHMAEIDGQTRAQKNYAEIQASMASIRHNNALTNLALKQIDLTGSQIDLYKSQKDLNLSQMKVNQANVNYTSASTVNERKQLELYNKQIDFLAEQIVTERFKQSYMSTEELNVRFNTTRAALDYVIDFATFMYKTIRGDSPDSTEVSSTQSEEKKKDRVHDYIIKGIGLAGTFVGGTITGMFFAPGRGINSKMFGDDRFDLKWKY